MLIARKIKLPAEVSGIRIPDTRLAAAATEFVSRVTPLWLMNHVLRTYVRNNSRALAIVTTLLRKGDFDGESGFTKKTG
jgi:hypothetical protein